MAENRPRKPYIVWVKDPRLEEPYPGVFHCSQEIYDSAVNLALRHDDIIIASYPKCGTTWTMYALYLLRSGGELPPGDLEGVIPFLEWGGAKAVENIKEHPRIIKTHLYWEVVPKHPDAKYVFVARNPKDCVVSFYHHTVGFEDYKFTNGIFDDYFEQFMKGEVDSGDYFRMVGKWYQQSKTNPNILFLLYEDMKDNFQRELCKMAEFLGQDWKQKLNADDGSLMKKILHETSFSNMNKRSAEICNTGRPDDQPFIRKGIIGDWKNMLNDEQSKRIEDKMKLTAEKYPGFDRIWEKYESLLK